MEANNITLRELTRLNSSQAYSVFWLCMVVLSLCTIKFLLSLRDAKGGPLEFSKRTKVIGFSIFFGLYVSVIYSWIFWHVIYELGVSSDAKKIEMVLLAPRRTVRIDVSQISSIRMVRKGRFGTKHLAIKTSDGRVYNQGPFTLGDHESIAIMNLLKDAIKYPQLFKEGQ